jgi:CHAD domain-containing protein
LDINLAEAGTAPLDVRSSSVNGAIAEQLEEIIRHDPGTRLGDPDALHDMRVAVRRLRAVLRAARSLLDEQAVDQLRGELKWLGEALGRVRDDDVLTERVRQQAATLPPRERRRLDELLQLLTGDSDRSRQLMLEALRDPRYEALLDRLDKAAESLTVSGNGKALERIAREQYRKLAKAVRRLGHSPTDDELHKVRINVKRARYATELATATPTRKRKRLIEALKHLQDDLGAHHDAAVAEPRLSEAGRTSRNADTALLAGRLAQIQVETRADVASSLLDTWRATKKTAGRLGW